MTLPLIDVPAIRVEGFNAARDGAQASRWAHEYRYGFCFVPEAYKPGSTERANFLQGCCYAVFGRPQ